MRATDGKSDNNNIVFQKDNNCWERTTQSVTVNSLQALFFHLSGYPGTMFASMSLNNGIYI